MAIDYNDLAINGVRGCRFQRINPDGTMPLPTRTIGGIGTFDVTGASDKAAIPLTIKFDNGTAVTITVDLSTATGLIVDETAVTVAEVVTAINAESPPNLTASTEAVTGYLKLAATVPGSISYLQVYGELAGIVGIGSPDGLQSTSQLGTKFLSNFSGTISVSEAKNVKEGEEIETESGNGDLRTLITDDILKGENPVITLQQNSYELKELIMGGVYNSTTRRYTPRTEDDTTSPRFYIETFAPMYGEGTSKKGDKLSYEMKVYNSCTGMEADISKETKAWVPMAYNCKATGYTDESGVKQPYGYADQLTLTEFSALDVLNV